MLIDRYAGDGIRSMEVVGLDHAGLRASSSIVADRFGAHRAPPRAPDRSATRIVIGAAQAVAFIPGISRSGITMVAARLLGFERAEAARFSFLLSIPAIAAAGAYERLQADQSRRSTAMLQDARMARRACRR